MWDDDILFPETVVSNSYKLSTDVGAATEIPVKNTPSSLILLGEDSMDQWLR